MKRTVVTVFLLGISLIPFLAHAYEPGTHQRLADDAAKQSVLAASQSGGSTILNDWGLTAYTDSTHLLPDAQQGRQVRIGPPGTGLVPTPDPCCTIQALVQAGAAVEDDTNRPPCHFFDPTNGQALHGVGLSVNYSDPDWALGSDYGNPINAPCTTTILGLFSYSSGSQNYSLTDANKYLYAALTSSAEGDRNQNFGDLFLAVGHSLHLLEDMAQPQHVRNETHCDDLKCVFGLKYSPSQYEGDVYNTIKYVDMAGNYVPNKFDKAREFWTDGGEGLADFTNQNFLSAGTLDFVDGSTTGYSSPTLNFNAAETEEDVADVYQNDLGKPEPSRIATFCNAQPNSCKLQFLSTNGSDAYTNQGFVNTKAASESIFNADLTDFGSHKVYTLNIVTEKSAWNLLQPMAIGYGTGLINYLFRGRLGVQPDPVNADSYIVSNLSAYELKGFVEFYYDDQYGNRTPIMSSITQVDLPAYSSGQPSATRSIQVVLPAYPQTQASGSFMAVFYNGTIGTEPGIAGKYFTDKFGLFADDDATVSSWGQGQIYTTPGEYINQLNLGVPDNYDIRMAASAGSLFATGYYPIGVGPNAAEAPVVVRDSSPIFQFPASLFVDELGLNDKYLFVAGAEANDQEPIFMFDLNGNPVDLHGNPVPPDPITGLPPPVVTVPLQYVGGIGANDSVMCVTGLDANGDAQDFLYSLSNGQQTATLTTSGQIGDTCAATSDRIYVARDLPTGGVDVDVYNNVGILITTLPLDSETESMGIAATDTQVYVEIFDYNAATATSSTGGYEQGVVVYQRDPATDTFSFLRTIWVSSDNGHVITRDIAVDVKAVIANNDQ